MLVRSLLDELPVLVRQATLQALVEEVKSVTPGGASDEVAQDGWQLRFKLRGR